MREWAGGGGGEATRNSPAVFAVTVLLGER